MMIMKRLVVFSFVFFMSLGRSYSQNILAGTILDKESGEPISYAMIGVNERYIGVVSDGKGEFTLPYNDKIANSDSITVTCLGYHALKMAVNDVKGSKMDIYMNISALRIDEVVVRAGEKKSVKIGYSSAGTRMLSTPLFAHSELDDSNELGKECGVVLKIKDDSDIKSLNFYLVRNDYDSIKLRVLFYSVEDGLPKDIIVNQDIVFEVTDKKAGWINVDLSSYNIQFEAGKDVAVALMALDETDRKQFFISLSLFKHNLVIRKGVQDVWNKNKSTISLYLGAESFR